MAASIFEFGDYRLDTERYELTRCGRNVALERKPMELLILLARSQGKLVSRVEIAGQLWGQEVFVDTEHGINTAIRKIRYVLRDDPESPRFVQTVTGKGYRFIAAPIDVNGARIASENAAPALPVARPPKATVAEAMIPAAVTEQKAHGAQQNPSRGWLVSGWMALAFAAVAFLLTAVSVRKQLQRSAVYTPALTSGIHSLAVLPLDNLSGDPRQDYLADGMTDELITMLAKNSTLRVISRTSVMQYKGVHRPLPEIAARLGVDGILEGSVARTGTRMHLNIQLIHAASDTHIWAESYDREVNDSVLLPRDAAIAIATKLKSAVPQPVPRYVSPAAHDAYLHGQVLFFTRDMESGAYFKKAIELQPDYSLGWSGLAKYYGDGADSGDLRPLEAIAQAKAAALKALDLDDSSAEAHMALGAAYWLDWSWAPALQETAEAIALGPEDGETYQIRAMLQITLNQTQEAIETEKKSLEVDPFARPYGLCMVYIAARQYDAAIAEAKQRLEFLPNEDGLYWQLATAYEAKGMYKEEEAAAMQKAALENNKGDAVRLHRIYLEGGHMALLRQELRDTQEAALKKYVSPYWFASLHAKLGHREETLRFLEAAYRERSPLLLWIQTWPEFDFVHGEERYRAIVRGMGLPPAY